MDSSYGEICTKREITEDLQLPDSIDGVNLTWMSDKPEYLANDGKVNRGEEDVEVTLTVEMKYGKKTKEEAIR